MVDIIIKLPDKPETQGKLVKGSYRVGSSPASHLQISRPEVSSRHAMIDVTDDGVFVQDAGSTNGTEVNGQIIGKKRISLIPGDIIGIGEAEISIRGKKDHAAPKPIPAKEPDNTPSAPISAPTSSRLTDENIGLLKVTRIPYQYRRRIQEVKRQVHQELIKRMNLKNLTLSGADQEEVFRQARETANVILQEVNDQIPGGVDRSEVLDEIVNEAVGLGPIELLMKDPTVTEIMANGAEHLYVEKAGSIYRTDMSFADNEQLLTIIERIVAPLGRRIDESQPLVDARLADGSRVNAIIPPLAIDGPSLTIRIFSKDVLTDQMLINYGSMTQEMAEFLRLSVLLRKNILISGGTGSGKTTLLNTMSNYLPNSDRIVTIEDAAELRLQKEHVVRLESRPPNIEGRGAIEIRDLVRNSLRMRPDRIVVGECRGGEALDMLQAMNTGHDGSLTTIHANSARDALARLETLVLMAGFDLPLRAIREQIAAALSLVVQIGRFKDGTRKVKSITEVTGMEGDVITTQDIFIYEQQGINEEGKIRGLHKPTGIVPTFVEDLQSSGLPFDIGIFNSNEDQGW